MNAALADTPPHLLDDAALERRRRELWGDIRSAPTTREQLAQQRELGEVVREQRRRVPHRPR